jgi:hypothetical protein
MKIGEVDPNFPEGSEEVLPVFLTFFFIFE